MVIGHWSFRGKFDWLTIVLKISKEHYSAWEKCANRLTSGYEYERSYATMMQEVEQQIFAVSVGEPPKDRNRKKLHTRFGKIEISKYHILTKSPGEMSISSFAQETMCFVGQQVVFEEAETLLNSLTGSSFNAKQIERVCHLYGGLLDQETQKQMDSAAHKSYSEPEQSALHYVMVNGAMYPTREKGEA